MNLFYLKRYQSTFFAFGFVVGVVLVTGSKAHSQTGRQPGQRPRRTITYVGGSPANPAPAPTISSGAAASPQRTQDQQTAPAPTGSTSTRQIRDPSTYGYVEGGVGVTRESGDGETTATPSTGTIGVGYQNPVGTRLRGILSGSLTEQRVGIRVDGSTYFGSHHNILPNFGAGAFVGTRLEFENRMNGRANSGDRGQMDLRLGGALRLFFREGRAPDGSPSRENQRTGERTLGRDMIHIAFAGGVLGSLTSDPRQAAITGADRPAGSFGLFACANISGIVTAGRLQIEADSRTCFDWLAANDGFRIESDNTIRLNPTSLALRGLYAFIQFRFDTTGSAGLRADPAVTTDNGDARQLNITAIFGGGFRLGTTRGERRDAGTTRVDGNSTTGNDDED